MTPHWECTIERKTNYTYRSCSAKIPSVQFPVKIWTGHVNNLDTPNPYPVHRRQICHRWKFATGVNKTMRTISACWKLKVNLKEKINLYANSATQRCQKVIMKTFLIEDFFHFPPVYTKLVEHLELRISLRIFEKIRNGPNGIIRGLGETDPCRKPEAENLVALSL
jgi:hypothetical protein